MPIKDIPEAIGYHLWMDEKISFRWKGTQLMDTNASMALLGLDTNAFAEYVVQETAVKVFEECETEMYGDTEVNEVINFCMITDNPAGMPWNNSFQSGEVWEDNGRRCFIFQVDRKQLERLKKILDYAKMHHKWEKYYNNRVVTVEMVPGWRRGEPKSLTRKRPFYQKMVREHGSNNKSTSWMVLNGMFDCETMFTLNRFDADGKPKGDVVRSSKMIIESLKWNGVKIFSMVAHIGDGCIAGFSPT